uniref:LRRCT domain-containing protein n=1 Tax=Sinocyclocheilus anshuiensis TaxID=1608454 RepID=A0A671PZW1_9TELE
MHLKIALVFIFILVHLHWSCTVDICQPGDDCKNQDVYDKTVTAIPEQFKDGADVIFFVNSQIPVIPKGVLSKNPQIKKIKFLSTSTHSVAVGAFEGLPDITLTLHNNQLVSLPDVLFGEMSKITELSLSCNNLTHFPTGVFSPLKKLKKLDLSSNQFSMISADFFESLEKLTDLNLQNNNIASLKQEDFEKRQSLSSLTLGNNKLQSLPGDVFDALPKLSKLYLNKNPWQCDCKLLPFFEWMKNNEDKIKSKPPEVCESPKNLLNQSITSLTEEQLICLTTSPTTTPLLTSTIPMTTLTNNNFNDHYFYHHGTINNCPCDDYIDSHHINSPNNNCDYNYINPQSYYKSRDNSNYLTTQHDYNNTFSHYTYGTFPLHGMVRFTFGGFPLGTVPGTFFSTTSVGVPSEPY